MAGRVSATRREIGPLTVVGHSRPAISTVPRPIGRGTLVSPHVDTGAPNSGLPLSRTVALACPAVTTSSIVPFPSSVIAWPCSATAGTSRIDAVLSWRSQRVG